MAQNERIFAYLRERDEFFRDVGVALESLQGRRDLT